MNFFNDVGYILINHWPNFLRGVLWTLVISLVATLIGLVIGLIIGIIRTIPKSKNGFVRVIQKVIDFILSAYIEVFRGTPMMVQAVVIYWGYAFAAGGQTLPLIPSAIVIVSINTGAYIAEIFRAGIQAIDSGQMEAGRSLGMTWVQTMRYIIIPQAFKNIIPPLGNEFIALLKDSSLVSVIGFEELNRRGQLIIARTYGSLEIWLSVALIYLVMTLAISRLVAYMEKRLKTK